MEFKLVLDTDVVDLLETIPQSRRLRFYAQLRLIQRYPANSSEVTEVGRNGETLDVATFDGYTIRYKIDDADRCVKIVEVLENE